MFSCCCYCHWISFVLIIFMQTMQCWVIYWIIVFLHHNNYVDGSKSFQVVISVTGNVQYASKV